LYFVVLLLIPFKKRKERNMNWKEYIKQAIEIGLNSPIPYKVIPYKNGVGIKKIEFLIPFKKRKAS